MNGWHYYKFNPFESEKTSEVYGTQVVEKFSIISRVEQSTGKLVKTFYVLGAQSITAETFEGLKGILYAEVVELYYNGRWAEMEVIRESFTVRTNSQNCYDITCKAELKNIGDIETALVLPPDLFEDEQETPLLGAETLYEEEFTGAIPFGYTYTESPAGNSIAQATVQGDSVMTVELEADPSNGINDSYVVMTLELTDYEFNYGTIKSTVGASLISALTAISYTTVSGYRQLVVVLGVGGDTDSGTYVARKKYYEKTEVMTQAMPLRYVQLRVFNSSKALLPNSIAVTAYVNYVKVERL
jgi:hypothetical protein